MLNDKFPCSNPFFPLLLKSVEHYLHLCVFRCLDNCLFFFVLPSFMSYFPNSLWHCLPTKFFFSPMWEKWYMNIFYPRVWCNPMLVLFSENLSKNKLLHIYIYICGVKQCGREKMQTRPFSSVDPSLWLGSTAGCRCDEADMLQSRGPISR